MNSNNEQSSEEQGFWTLSGKKPFFSVILAPTHLEPAYRLNIPAKMVSVLPSVTIPVVLIYQGKEWEMNYIGKNNRFDRNWRRYANDNNLKVGDGCVFELKEFDPEKLVFRTQILRDDTPLQTVQKLLPGECVEHPIDI